MTMRKSTRQLGLLAAFALIASSALIAQDSGSAEKLAVGVSLNHDAFFGFNPMITASYPLNKKSELTFYGIQWGAGTASAWANWTEFGMGVNIKAGDFAINPQLGFTMGSLLSSGAAQRGVIGDGIVPNLTINLNNTKLIGQAYGGYYAALRQETQRGNATNNYMHYWFNLGAKATPWLALGAHFEHLYLAGGKGNGVPDLERTEGFQWIGPFIQVSKGIAGFRFSFGGDLTKDSESFSDNDFYKMNIFLNF